MRPGGEFSHEIAVNSLAKSQTLAFDGFKCQRQYWHWITGIRIRDMERQYFTGNGTSQTVNISTGNDLLEGIAASINDAQMGVTASVVQKSNNNYALVIRSRRASTTMRISVTPMM